MNVYLILLRLIHIGSGVFWAGTAIMIAAFLEPTVRAAGPEGGRFMQQLTGQSRFSLSMSLSALLNALSGPLLYWPLSEHLRGSSHKGVMT
jgi:hypothetical protein